MKHLSTFEHIWTSVLNIYMHLLHLIYILGVLRCPRSRASHNGGRLEGVSVRLPDSTCSATSWAELRAVLWCCDVLRMGAVDFSVGYLSSVCSEVLSWTSDYVRLSWWGINSWNSVEIGTMILSEPEMWFSRFCFPELQRPDLYCYTTTLSAINQ